MSYLLIVKQRFSGAHFIPDYVGPCGEMHGHTWEVRVFIRARKLNNWGIAIDFKNLKEGLKILLPDHKNLNEVFSFSPTAENLAKCFYQQINKNMDWFLGGDVDNVHLEAVEVWESEDCGVRYED